MGVIFRASQRHSCRIVAVNACCVITRIPAKRSARFRHEAQAAASLDHPNIVPIHEVSDNEDGLRSLAVKFASGGSLQEASPALRDEFSLSGGAEQVPRRHKNHPRFPKRNPSHEKIPGQAGSAVCVGKFFRLAVCDAHEVAAPSSQEYLHPFADVIGNFATHFA